MSIEQYILIGVLVIALIAASASLIGLDRLKNLLEKIQEIRAHIPDREFSDKIADSVNGFESANEKFSDGISSLNISLREMPSTISGTLSREIESGLQPLLKDADEIKARAASDLNRLIQELQSSHQHFQAVVMGFSEDGHFQEIIRQMGETVAPLKQVGESVSHHYDVLCHLVKSTSDIILQWTEQRAEIDKSYSDFADQLKIWTSEEQIHHRSIEKRLFERLRELGELEGSLCENVGNLNSKVLELTNAHRILRDSVQQSSQTIADIARYQEDTVRIQQDTVSHQQKLQAQLQIQQVQLQQSSSELQKRSGELIDCHINMINGIQSSYSSMNRRQESEIEELTALQAELGQQCLQMVQSQKEYLDSFRSQLESLTDTRPQKLQSALLIALTAMMAALCLMSFFNLFPR